MPKFEKHDGDKETQKKTTEKKEVAEKPVTTKEVVEAQRAIILNHKDGLYSYKKSKSSNEYYDVTIQGNNIVLHQFKDANITQLFKGELNKGQLTLTLDKKGTGVINRADGSYSGSKEGLKDAKKYLADCEKYIKLAIEQKNNKKEVASLENNLENAYA